MALIPTQSVPTAGLVTTWQAAAAGDTTAVGANLKLYVLNGSGSSITVTLSIPELTA